MYCEKQQSKATTYQQAGIRICSLEFQQLVDDKLVASCQQTCFKFFLSTHSEKRECFDASCGF